MYIFITFVTIALHGLITTKCCNAKSKALNTAGKAIGWTGIVLGALLILCTILPNSMLPERFVTQFGFANIGLCIFVLELYAVLLLTGGFISDSPQRLLAFLVPGFFFLQVFFLSRGELPEELLHGRAMLSTLSLFFALDYIDDYLYRVRQIKWGWGLPHLLIWLPNVLCMFFTLLNYFFLSFGVMFAKNVEAATMFGCDYYFVALLIVIAAPIIVHYTRDRMSYATRTGSNVFWKFLGLIIGTHLFYEMGAMCHEMGWFSYITLMLACFLSGFITMACLADDLDFRCPNCHNWNQKNYQTTTCGGISEREYEFAEYEGAQDKKIKGWEVRIHWYKRKRRKIISQEMFHHFCCKECGEKWETTSLRTISDKTEDA